MTSAPSENTKAILLLTGPLLLGGRAGVDPLSPGEYRTLAIHLHGMARQPSDLLGSDSERLLETCRSFVEPKRMRALLDRGLLLSQAMERWSARAIWVVSRADPAYPRRLKERLREAAPAVLYGVGARALLEGGGLAVVGSRAVDDELIRYTEEVGALAAGASRTLLSGGARGIDQAAMRGALAAGGSVVGVLADGLEKAAMSREHREALMEGRLVLVSPYDPGAGFNVGNAMQRNKLIYALADAALVVGSDVEKGGTWAGAVEQLGRLRLVPVYVRSTGAPSRGLEALRQRGARAWPNPSNGEALAAVLSEVVPDAPRQGALPLEGGTAARIVGSRRSGPDG